MYCLLKNYDEIVNQEKNKTRALGHASGKDLGHASGKDCPVNTIWI